MRRMETVLGEGEALLGLIPAASSDKYHHAHFFNCCSCNSLIHSLPLISPFPCFPAAAPTPCGGVLDASSAGYITSPGYPLEYPPYLNCHWIITAPEPSQRIVLNFNPHFEIERLDCK